MRHCSHDEVQSPFGVYSTVGHTEYREKCLYDFLLFHYLSHPLKPLIMALHFLSFSSVHLLNSLCLISLMFMSIFKKHTFAHGHFYMHTHTDLQWWAILTGL